MDKIVPHLWFDKEAQEAAELYTSALPGSGIENVTTIRGTPSGDCDIVAFSLAGQEFQAISAGPLFKFNPSTSFLVACETTEEVDELWGRLADGTPLMPLGDYPFSKRYGWTQDRYGLSWQIKHVGDRTITQKVIPTLLFVGEVCGKAEEAIGFYVSAFEGSEVGGIDRYGAGEEPDVEGTVRHASLKLAGYELAAMDSALDHRFAFNEAISLMVYCDDQAEVDHYWGRLSAVPESEQCGWLKDRFGVSWQIVPKGMDEMMRTADRQALDRLTQSFLGMKKLDLAAMQEAYAGPA